MVVDGLNKLRAYFRVGEVNGVRVTVGVVVRRRLRTPVSYSVVGS